MTTESSRTIIWDIPLRHDSGERPHPEAFDFAAWLTQQDTATTSETDRLKNMTQFLYHVSEKLSPSKHRARGPGQHRCAAAYKDKRIVQEFGRWAASLDWTAGRDAYMKILNTLLSPLATPLTLQCCEETPRLRFGLQLAYALHHDGLLSDKNMEPKAILESARHLATLGLPEPEKLSSNDSALLLCLRNAASTHIAPDMEPHFHVFRSLYDPGQNPHLSLNRKHGKNVFDNALFHHLIQVYTSPAVDTNMALPENTFDMV